MPRAHYTAEGGVYRIGRLTFEPGDEKAVDRETAQHLSDRDDFDVTIEKQCDTAESDDGTDEADGDDEDEADSDDDQADGFDATAFVDRTPMDDVVGDIEAGEVDGHLDAVQAAEEEGRDRVGVQDAIGQRRADLEG